MPTRLISHAAQDERQFLFLSQDAKQIVTTLVKKNGCCHTGKIEVNTESK